MSGLYILLILIYLFDKHFMNIISNKCFRSIIPRNKLYKYNRYQI